MLYPCFDVMVNCVIKVPWTDIAPEYDNSPMVEQFSIRRFNKYTKDY